MLNYAADFCSTSSKIQHLSCKNYILESEMHPEEVSLIYNQVAATNQAVCVTRGVLGIIIGINIMFLISILTAMILIIARRKKQS